MNARRRESVKGLATPAAKADNRFRIAVVSVVLAMTPASFLGCNTNKRRRFRSTSQLPIQLGELQYITRTLADQARRWHLRCLSQFINRSTSFPALAAQPHAHQASRPRWD